jgi:TorA maturation chaperone TorD
MSARPQINAQDARLARLGEIAAADLLDIAALHAVEPDSATLTALRAADFPNSLGLAPTSLPAQQAARFMADALAAMSQPVDRNTIDQIAADFTNIYLLHTLRASPEESVWFNDEGCMRQEPMFQVRAFYRRHGLEAANWRVTADDHLVPQLAFIAHLVRQARPDELREAARFMDEHLLRWIDRFAERVARRCATPYFAGLAGLTATYVEDLRNLLARILDEPRPTAEDIERRMAAQPEPVSKPLNFMPGSAPTW